MIKERRGNQSNDRGGELALPARRSRDAPIDRESFALFAFPADPLASIVIITPTTGEVLRQLTPDPTRRYQPQTAKNPAP